jgi:hypothetical protein
MVNAKQSPFGRLAATPLCLILVVLGVTEAGCAARRIWIDKGGMTETAIHFMVPCAASGSSAKFLRSPGPCDGSNPLGLGGASST